MRGYSRLHTRGASPSTTRSVTPLPWHHAVARPSTAPAERPTSGRATRYRPRGSPFHLSRRCAWFQATELSVDPTCPGDLPGGRLVRRHFERTVNPDLEEEQIL